jgi:hypothetical protein
MMVLGFGKKKIKPEKIKVDAEKDDLIIEYEITDRIQMELAAGKLSLHKKLYEDWGIFSDEDKVVLSFKTVGPVTIEDVVEKIKGMVS